MDAPEYISDLFRHAINLERSAETLYKGMAELFSREPAVRKFWEQYANEEKTVRRAAAPRLGRQARGGHGGCGRAVRGRDVRSVVRCHLHRR